MEPSKSPTLKELKSIRNKMLRQIEGAKLIFQARKDQPELQLINAALQSIEELIESAQKTEAA